MFIKVLDVNDNAPEFAMSYDTFVCENVKAGQVRHTSTWVSSAARSQECHQNPQLWLTKQIYVFDLNSLQEKPSARLLSVFKIRLEPPSVSIVTLSLLAAGDMLMDGAWQ